MMYQLHAEITMTTKIIKLFLSLLRNLSLVNCNEGFKCLLLCLCQNAATLEQNGKSANKCMLLASSCHNLVLGLRVSGEF